MKTYLLTYSPPFGESCDVMSLLKSIDSIFDLRSPYSGFFFIKSSDTATGLSKKILSLNPGKRFFISELSLNRQGWLPRDNWEFIKTV